MEFWKEKLQKVSSMSPKLFRKLTLHRMHVQKTTTTNMRTGEGGYFDFTPPLAFRTEQKRNKGAWIHLKLCLFNKICENFAMLLHWIFLFCLKRSKTLPINMKENILETTTIIDMIQWVNSKFVIHWVLINFVKF